MTLNILRSPNLTFPSQTATASVRAADLASHSVLQLRMTSLGLFDLSLPEKLTQTLRGQAKAVSISVQTAQKHSQNTYFSSPVSYAPTCLTGQFLEILKLIELCSLVPIVLESWPDSFPRRLCGLDLWQLGSLCRCESVRNWGKRIITVFEKAIHLSFL